jgi:hypothetical protein
MKDTDKYNQFEKKAITGSLVVDRSVSSIKNENEYMRTMFENQQYVPESC